MLNTSLKYLPTVGPGRADLLKKELSLTTYGDLLEYFPYKYVDRSKIYKICELVGELAYVQICGEFLSFETLGENKYKRRYVGHFYDGFGNVDIVWFSKNFDPTKGLKVNTQYIVFGKPSYFNGRVQFSHPDIELASNVQLSEMGMQPHYHTTEVMKKRNFNSRQVEKLTRKLLDTLTHELPETLPPFIVNRLNLCSRDTALRKIHYPKTAEDVAMATRRLKFEELFYVQLNILRYATEHHKKYRGFVMTKVGLHFNNFYFNRLKFPLTEAQKRVVREIKGDISSGRQMNRLLQGDVGSGKTIVALMAMLLAIDNGFQACIIAPTEILAEQHLQTIEALVGNRLSVRLLTGMVKGKKREALLQELAAGEINILIGTHAVMEDTVNFHNLGLVVVDEQHRFGVAQRAKLWGKNLNPPHVLVMTATPIPRTLAMTIYGDLDVSVIDELPPGRKPVQTIHRYEDQMPSVYDGIRYQINQGRQVYFVYPQIKEIALPRQTGESEGVSQEVKNLEDGFNHLLEVFPNYKLSKVHGQMKPAEKDEEMRRFVAGETQILVATTVIEVGVNVPNASVMVIQNAERFGLSQLHQLRGRVGRGSDQSFCILISKRSLSEDTNKRIDIMCQTTDGFRIAEADLKLRGPGDLEGTQQSGMAFDLKIANIARDGELIQLARDEARRVIESDPDNNRPENAILWHRLRELKKSLIDWSAIS